MLPREDIALALIALLAPLQSTSPPLVATLSRRIVPAVQIQPAQCPAVFQVISDEHVQEGQRTLEGMYVSVMGFDWMVYAYSAPSTSTAPSSVLNPIVDAVLGKLPPAGVPFVVDGVAMPLFWDGTIDYVDGMIANISIARIPVKVMVPWATP